MSGPLEESLSRWQNAGLIDSETSASIIEFETSRRSSPRAAAAPVVLALIFGAILLAAGISLFVAAHWDELSPAARFSVVAALVVGFHIGAAFCDRPFPLMARTLHAIGTVAFGAGIFLCGQIFNLAEEWPEGLLLWALGACVGWYLRKDWIQLLFVAMLTPAAISSEWTTHQRQSSAAGFFPALGLSLLAITYLSALKPDGRSASRKMLSRLGAVALIPVVLVASFPWPNAAWPPPSAQLLAVGLFLVPPLALAWWLRGSEAWKNGVSAVWVFVLGALRIGHDTIAMEAWCALGSVGLVAWGVNESRPAFINLGTIGFALSVIFFYSTDVMDKLGRSLSLIVLGVLFLAGGWALEQTRRRLVAGLA